MPLNELASQLVQDFGGAWPYLDAPRVPSGRALLAWNMRYKAGEASSRTGFGLAFNSNEAATGLFNWLGPLGNLLCWYRSSDNSIRYIDISAVTPTAAALISANLLGHSANFANASSRLFVAPFNTLGRGAAPPRVAIKQGAGFVDDACFAAPITYAPGAPTEPSAGRVTAGLHRWGYRIRHRNGFLGRPNPDSGSTTPGLTSNFLPLQFTATPGFNKFFTLNTTWPASAVGVQLIMAPVVNQGLFIQIPGAYQAVTGGTLQSITFTVDITDDELMSEGINSNAALQYLTLTTAAVAPFNAFDLFIHNNRMIYVTTMADSSGNQVVQAFASQRGDFQALLAADGIIDLAGHEVFKGASVAGAIHFFGSTGTLRAQDNGNEPAFWPLESVHDSIGTHAPRGVGVSSNKRYAWVADKSGLYLFMGSYTAQSLFGGGGGETLPISYNQTSDWQRINWNAAYAVEVVDHTEAKRVVVKAPLDGATTATHLLTWDYTRGMTPSKADYSLDSIIGYNPGGVAVVLNTLNAAPSNDAKHHELWLAPSSAAEIKRLMNDSDTGAFSEGLTPIDWRYKLAGLPSKSARGQVYLHSGTELRGRGTGQLPCTVKNLDETRAAILPLITLSSAPGKEILKRFNLKGEAAFYDFWANLAADPGFEIKPPYKGTTIIGAQSDAWIGDLGVSFRWDYLNSNAHTGVWCASRLGDATAPVDTFRNQQLSVAAPGDSFYVECWAKSDGGATGTFQVRVMFLDSTGTEISAILSSPLSPTTTYTKVSASGTAPAGSVSCKAEILTQAHTAARWYADDVKMLKAGNKFAISSLKHYHKPWIAVR